MKRFSFLIAFVLVFLTGCDVKSPFEDVNLILDVEDTEVDLGAGVSVLVAPGQPSAKSETVANNLDVESVDELRRIELKPSFFSFQASAGKSGGSATGTLKLYIFFDGIPLPQTPITISIVDDVVTSISPSEINFLASTYTLDEAGVEAFLNSLPPAQRPDLAAWQNMTMDQVRAALNAALSDASIPVSIGTEVTDSDPSDPLTGNLQLNALSLDARIRK